MKQFIPQVSDLDVERVIKRDLPIKEQEEIRKIVRQIEVREKPRVILACLKNSAGDIRKLKIDLAEASGYYREIIGEAEYPNYMKKAFRIDELSNDERKEIIEKDKNQYLSWLHGKNP
jgi:hypothetical protein